MTEVAAEITVLIIDDEESVRASFSMFLEDSGYGVVTADNGRKGIEAFDARKPDIVLVDLRMPEVGGHDVIRHINEVDADIPVIVISGTDILEDAIKALRFGAWDYLTKPVMDMNGLLHRVEETLEKSKLIRENRLYQEHLETLVTQRTLELENSNRALAQSVYNTIVILTQIIEAKDPYTRGHSMRVSDYSVALGEVVGLEGQQLQILRLGSLLHDIGKIGISNVVLNKPGRLSSDEYEKIKEHTLIGEKILQNVVYFEPVLPLIRNHHRWHDGNGYPISNKEEIPLESEILAVADVFDALTSQRPYREAMRTGEALSVLKELRGTQLSPELVDVFIEREIYDIEHSLDINIELEHVLSEVWNSMTRGSGGDTD